MKAGTIVTISVVVPVYNVFKYLPECLDSIIGQSLSDLEVICVNDGSTDNSLDILNRYALKDSRIIVVDKPNSGYGNTMNVGFEWAQGEYIAIVESDDYIDADMFEILYNVAKNNDCDIVKSDYYEFTTTEKNNPAYINTVTIPSFYNKVLNHNSCPDLYNFRMNTWTGIYRRTFIEKYHIRHNETPGASYQDNGFWFQTLSLADRIIFVNKAFYHYRQDNPNSSINSKMKVFCMCDEYGFIENFLNESGLYNELIDKFLIKKYFNYMYTYKRISDENKLIFLERFSNEFRKHKEDGLITRETVGDYVFGMLNRIINNYELFYYEDTIYSLQHQSINDAMWVSNYLKNKSFRGALKWLKSP